MKRLWMAVCLLALGGLAGCGGDSSAPGGASGPLVGMWGARDINAALRLTSTGGQLTLYCGWGGPLSQPVTPDATGHFDVPGRYSSNVPDLPVHYAGTVSGDVIALTVTYTYTSMAGTPTTATEGAYTLYAGQQPPATSPFPDGACPG